MKYVATIVVFLFVAGRVSKAYSDMMYFDWGFYE